MRQDIINSDLRLKNHIDSITKLYNDKKYLRVSITIGMKRTVEQSDLSFDVYHDLKKAGKFESINEARAYCKLTFGVPILNEDEEFRAGMSKLSKYRLSYEDKLSMMLDPVNLPVTSRMTREQFSRYIESIGAKFPDVEFRSLI
ncbi:MAG: hypothetical protein ACTSV7_00580 [Candidatus Baldrarchaeia archaeon]